MEPKSHVADKGGRIIGYSLQVGDLMPRDGAIIFSDLIGKLDVLLRSL
jgi:hypothetical protein